MARSARCLPAAARLAVGVAASRLSRSRRAARMSQVEFYRVLWTSAAADVGAVVARGPSGELVEIGLPGRSVQVRGGHPVLDPPEVLERAGNKALVAALLVEAGIPVPPQLVFSLDTIEAAERFLSAAPGPCVVKPARDTGAGRGVTTGIRYPRDLRRAAAVAAAAGARGTSAAGAARGSAPGSVGLARRAVDMLSGLGEVPLLVEHQIPGANFRLLYLDGVLIDAIRRDPPTVHGDGVRSVSDLLDALNWARLAAGGATAQALVTRDLELEMTLAGQGLTLAAVPAAGHVVALKTAINENAPDGNAPAAAVLCPAIVEQGATAAAIVGARLAGVDIVTTDPTVPLAGAGGCVLEVNTTPGLAMHYHGHEGAAAPATALLRSLA